MTRSYAEQLGDALADILNPPPPHVYYVKNVREGLEAAGWERIEITVGRIIKVYADRVEDNQRVAMTHELSYCVIEHIKYPIMAVNETLKSYERGLQEWRITHPKREE